MGFFMVIIKVHKYQLENLVPLFSTIERSTNK